MADLVLRSRRVVLDGRIVPATVEIDAGRITAIRESGAEAPPDALGVIDLGDRVLMAGLVDAHVHINEPGRTEWEGFVTATAAAAVGGITTVVDMPLNCIPVTTTAAALAIKAREAAGRCAVDYAFWGGVVPGNAAELAPMIDAGVAGFKCFLVHSGIDDFPASTEADLREAMPIIARKGSVLLVHAELPGPIDAAEAAQRAHPEDPRRYDTFLRSRPRASENEAIAMMIRLSREDLQRRVHIVHLSSSDALPMLAEAKRQGVPISAETCPHYLTFAAEEIPDGATQYKCCPPIRERDNRDRLWEGLREGILDVVVSDHSPCTPSLKLPEQGDFLGAWGGIASLQFGLSSIWTEASRRGFAPTDLSRWMSRSSAALAGLSRKGRIEVGCDADLVVWSPERSFTPEPATIRHRHAVTPYLGRSLLGVVEQTFLRGVRVDGEAAGAPPRGEWVKPSASRGILPAP